jgi:hypothetical protein
MSDWHTCKTKHCICGWAEHLGGPLAKLIIEQFGNDVGGLMLLGVEAHAHFYKNIDDDARAFLQSVIDQANASQEASSTIMPDDAPEPAWWGDPGGATVVADACCLRPVPASWWSHLAGSGRLRR